MVHVLEVAGGQRRRHDERRCPRRPASGLSPTATAGGFSGVIGSPPHRGERLAAAYSVHGPLSSLSGSAGKSRKSTSTLWPMATVSGSAPRSSPSIRTPSSSSTSAITNGSGSTRHLRRMVHDEAEHRAAAGGHDVVGGLALGLPQRRHRRVLQRTVGALLQAQLVGGHALPEELRVPGRGRPHQGISVQIRRYLALFRSNPGLPRVPGSDYVLLRSRGG